MEKELYVVPLRIRYREVRRVYVERAGAVGVGVGVGEASRAKRWSAWA